MCDLMFFLICDLWRIRYFKGWDFPGRYYMAGGGGGGGGDLGY